MKQELDILLNTDNRAELYIKEVISPLLPNAELENWLTAGISNYSDIEIGLSNLDICKGSNYEFNFDGSDSVELIHFTSINNLFSILRSKSLWMRDLNSMEDENEFIFANKFLPQHDDVQKLKKKIMSLSFLLFSEDQVKNEYMWKKYGDDHKGVCIKFKLKKLNSAQMFMNPYHISKIKYRCIEKEISELKLLKERHNAFLENYGYAANNINEILLVLSASYKNKKEFHKEQEIRILKYIKNLIPEFTYDSKSKKTSRFVEFPINSIKTRKNHPILNIQEFIFGKNVDMETIPLITDSASYSLKTYINWRILRQKTN
ncbi:DUF2971 domain-containing protein [Wenyingzhuangia sp. IMCC45574]